MGVDVPFYYFDNYEETIDAFKDYILHQDSQYWQLATTYGKSLESFSIEIALPHFYMPPKIFSRLSPKFN